MRQGAHTPEELGTLLEDAFVIHDREALSGLFEEGAVLVTGDGLPEARGTRQIASRVAAMWAVGRTYVADPGRVLQARDTALVVADRGISVLRRGGDGAWRYAISVLSLGHASDEEES
jgi:hypothetical protein